ncbi:hypothetical protein HK104_006464, partial [Borealophlyctis nickersoniae]
GEIDNITRRTKTAETAFLNLYKVLAEAPDPEPLIATLVDQSRQLGEIKSLELENRRLKDDLALANSQLASARNAEGSIVTLKSRLSKYEAMLDDMVNEKVAQKENEMKQAMDEKIRIYKETEHSLQRQLSQVKDQLVNLQSSHDVTQARLVDHSQKYDEEVAAKLGELEIVLVDLERVNLKVAQLERDNELLRQDLAVARGNEEGRSKPGEWQDVPALLKRNQSLEVGDSRVERTSLIVDLFPIVAAPQADVTRLLLEAEKLKESLKEKEMSSAQRIGEAERDIAVKTLEVAELEAKLVQFDDYDKIKRELDIIKSVEFGGSEGGDGDASASDYPLERLLLDKNKKLQGEVTAAKVKTSETEAELDGTRSQLAEIQRRCDQQQSLITKLEDDLAKLNNMWANGLASAPTLDPLAALVGNTGIGPSFDAKGIARPLPSTPTTPSQSGSAGTDGNPSIVPILTSQRDRYRQKNAELEEQIRGHLATISDLRNEIEKLKSDNVKLYEKLRYTQSFQESAGR